MLITIQIENYAGTHLVILQFDNLMAEISEKVVIFLSAQQEILFWLL